MRQKIVLSAMEVRVQQSMNPIVDQRRLTYTHATQLSYTPSGRHGRNTFKKGLYLSSAASYGSKLPWSNSARLSYKAREKGGRRFEKQRLTSSRRLHVCWAQTNDTSKNVPQNVDLPRPPPRHKKKPWITPPTPGGFLKKLKRGPPKLRIPPAPANGLLVPKLIPVAHQVLKARKLVMHLIPKLMQVVSVHTCKYCTDSHVGPVGHGIATCNGVQASRRRSRHEWTMAKPSDVFPSLDAYHLYDRLKTVYHAERFSVPRLPALVELCIQAGVELPEYPTLRRKYPIKAIGKRIIEENTALFEFNDEVDPFADIVAETSSDSDTQSEDNYSSADSELDFLDGEESEAGPHGHDVDIDTLHYNGSDFLDENIFIEDSVLSSIFDANREMSSLSSEEVAHVAQVTLDSWQSMREGVRRLMSKYSVRVCGYCPEVHIGPRGHKVKICGAFKHQWRAGQHGWQKATLEDLIPPKYVWHVQNLNAPLLHNQLRRYYGQAPAVVELCVQAGAMIPEEFKPMMRLDIVVPDVDEIYHAV